LLFWRIENERIMTMDVNTELQKIWGTIPRTEQLRNEHFDIGAQKKLLDIFHVGDYFYYIFNVRKGMYEMISEEAERILGYPLEKLTLPFILSIIHPDDLPHFLNFETAITQFFNALSGERLFKYKVQHDFRMLKANGDYIRILNQFIIIQHDAEDVRTFFINTDISHLKKDLQPVLSFIGLEGEPSYYNVDVKNIFRISKPIFTNREKEIIKALAKGMNSSQISDILHISKHTVDSHRKNMLRKTEAKSTSELISIAFSKGWV